MYTIYHLQSGIQYSSRAKTLAGAKREASADMTFGGGSVYVNSPDGTACVREFWRCLNRFGWDKWRQVGGMPA